MQASHPLPRALARPCRLLACLAAAALLEGVETWRGARVGVIVSGGNVDLPRYAAMLATA